MVALSAGWWEKRWYAATGLLVCMVETLCRADHEMQTALMSLAFRLVLVGEPDILVVFESSVLQGLSRYTPLEWLVTAVAGLTECVAQRLKRHCSFLRRYSAVAAGSRSCQLPCV